MNWKHIKIMWLVIILFHVGITAARADTTDLCTTIGNNASYIMQLRQSGVEATELAAYIDLSNITLYNMAVQAWRVKVFTRDTRKRQVIQSFGNVHEYRCLVYIKEHSL